MLYILPSISISEVEDLTLLDMDKKIHYLLGVRKNHQRHLLKDLSCLIFYGVGHGYASVKSKKPVEKHFHDLMSKLLFEDEIKENSGSPEADLKSLFG